jgi:hypothetical protein
MNRYQVADTLHKYNLNNVNVVFGRPIPIGQSIVYAWVYGSQMGHWVAIERDEKTTLLVDSYGLRNDKRYHIPFLGSKYIWSNFHGQRYGTKYCALYAIAYYILRQSMTFGQALEALYPNTGVNKHNSTYLSSILGENADHMLARFKPQTSFE